MSKFNIKLQCRIDSLMKDRIIKQSNIHYATINLIDLWDNIENN